MTVAEMIAEVRQALGNRQDIDGTRIALWLNWAQHEVCGFHRKRMFNPKRFHALEGEAIFAATKLTGVVGGSPTTTAIPLVGAFSATDDAYNGRICELGSELRRISDYVGGTGVVTCSPAFSAAPTAGDAVSLYQRSYSIVTDIGVTDLWSVERLENADDGTVLTMAQWEDIAGKVVATKGTPSSFAHRGGNIVFDVAPDATTLIYRLIYYAYPATILSTSTTVTLPDQWHEIFVLGAVYRGFQRLMEPIRAAEARNEFVERVTNIRDEFEWESQGIQRRARVRLV